MSLAVRYKSERQSLLRRLCEPGNGVASSKTERLTKAP